ncbi:MAG: LytTR family DNA-binding domain-containing protein [Bacteroidia bacterium]|nr:LytTR family DNA-binding domain-containing protein [Bacteroidia bacterium]
MKTVSCLLVDDEPIAREILISHLDKVPNWHVKHACMNAEEAYEVLLKEDIDVIFLDIEMPEISGVEFLQSLKNPPLVIFTTAYSEYALKGYELNVVDYLLKPIAFNRFFQSIEKANLMLEVLNNEKKSDIPSPPFIFVKHAGKLIKINFEDIIYVKAEQEYSLIVLEDAKVLASKHLKLLLRELPDQEFSRIHRSYILSHHKISSISGNQIQLKDGTELPIGNTYKEELLQKLQI